MNWVNNSASVLSNNDNLSFYVLNTFLTPSCCDFNCCALLWGAASTYEVQFSENESDWKVFALTTEWHFSFFFFTTDPYPKRKSNSTALGSSYKSRQRLSLKDWHWSVNCSTTKEHIVFGQGQNFRPSSYSHTYQWLKLNDELNK